MLVQESCPSWCGQSTMLSGKMVFACSWVTCILSDLIFYREFIIISWYKPPTLYSQNIWKIKQLTKQHRVLSSAIGVSLILTLLIPITLRKIKQIKRRNIFAFHIILLLWNMCSLLKLTPGEGKDIYTTNSQYHGCWWLGDTRSQRISSEGIDLVCPESSSFSTMMINMCDMVGNCKYLYPCLLTIVPTGFTNPFVYPYTVDSRYIAAI